ncbi:formate dehydrogenase (NAD+) [Phytophthora pseudosyringae]|uniref:Formate dehydrogenase (NAD+) n=1 Tax=Phytophthora pseudosyringae TaxID=221518 RepID=A0A8T1VNZ4_9STRA|nr:formate dehydrogenase (NAD+) [Phytophthora pseudosyringae]
MPPTTAALPGKKRRSPPHPQDERDSDTSEHEGGTEEVTHKRQRGYRKASHALRKEEIGRLRLETAQLQSQMRKLQQRAFAPASDEEAGGDKKLSASVLQNIVKKQQSTFVDIQATMSGYAACSIQCGSPIQRVIVLPNDELSRRSVLRSMKTLKLKDARRFMSRRLLHLNPLNTLSEERRFENDEGDYWAVRFTTSQFESARSVKQVFDLVVYFLSNSEISISEKVGHLTVREDDDNGEPGIAQHRLVSTTGKGLHMESNTVNFYEYHEAGTSSEDAYGLIVSEFVDEDERHPYRPKTRIRKDANVVMEVRAYTRRPRIMIIDDQSLQQEKVVVLTLWSHSRLRRPNFPVPEHAWHELCENMDRWSQNMHKTIMETLDPAI